MQELVKYAAPNTELLPDRNARIGVGVQLGIAVKGTRSAIVDVALRMSFQAVDCSCSEFTESVLVTVRSTVTVEDNKTTH